MAKTTDEDFNGDFWLHVATDSLRRYVEDGGLLEVVVAEQGMVITLQGVTPDDERVHGKFARLVRERCGGGG